MSAGDFLKGLKIDVWYKAGLAVSSVVLVLALVTSTKWLSNKQTILLFGGLWLISVAEWKMDKTYTTQAGLNLISIKRRTLDPGSVLMELVGFALVVVAVLDFLGIY